MFEALGCRKHSDIDHNIKLYNHEVSSLLSIYVQGRIQNHTRDDVKGETILSGGGQGSD